MQKRRTTLIYILKYLLPLFILYTTISKVYKFTDKERNPILWKPKYELSESHIKFFENEGKKNLVNYLYQLPPEVYEGLLENSLQDLPLSQRPQPQSLKIIIASTWRSGTSFLNNVLSCHPGVFNHYEPLHHFGIKSFYNESNKDTIEAQNFFLGILKCRYYDEMYFKNNLEFTSLVKQNRNTWNLCEDGHEEICYEKDFIQATCPLFPINLIKSVRLGLSLMRPALEDQTQNVNIIFLVRDPRAVINSRRHLTNSFCLTSNCISPVVLCQNLKKDYESYLKLSEEFPGRVILMRYEDISLDPYTQIKKLLKSINLDFDRKMKKFIETHTTQSRKYSYTTYKKSSLMVTAWLSKLDIRSLINIQVICSDIMKKLGYKLINIKDNIDVNELLDTLDKLD